MHEKLIPLKLPAGLVNNGTLYQTKGRWSSGNCVRFYQKKIQPIGGWVARTTTGATISGTPNAAISWQANDGNTYFAIGTTTNLYVLTSANVVYNITPASATGETNMQWQLDVFGSYLLGTFQRSAYVDDTVINSCVWRGAVADIAEPAYTVFTGPGSTYGVVVTPERFMVVLRGADPTTWDPDTSDGTGGEDPDAPGPDGGAGSAPSVTPNAPTITADARPGRGTATWTNNDLVSSIRIEWSTSDTENGTYTVVSVVESSPETTSRTFSTTDTVWVKARLQYFNTTGDGPWGSLSSAVEITGLS